MKRFAFYINKGDNIIKLEEPLSTATNSRMTIRNMDVFWDFKNVPVDASVNYGTDITFPAGYWSFEDIQKRLKSGDITLTLNPYDSTCSIYGEDHPIKLKTLGPLLGFENNTTIAADTITTSTKKVNINNSVRFLNLKCNITSFSRNYFNGRRSQIIACVPVTTQQKLSGTVSHFSDRYCAIPMYNGTFQEIGFLLESDNQDKNFNASILLEIEIY